MKQHKWHKEIKAWAEGAEIEYRHKEVTNSNWVDVSIPNWFEDVEYRIKPQPKKPQYLYAYKVNAKIVELYDELQMAWDGKMFLGKIKLEVEDD
jgi:hypothetical protein